MSIQHATFVVERTYALSPARVFAAWADPELKARGRGMARSWAGWAICSLRPRQAEAR